VPTLNPVPPEVESAAPAAPEHPSVPSPWNIPAKQKYWGRWHWLSRLRSYLLYDPLIWSYTIVCAIVSLTLSLVDRNGRMQHFMARTWSRLIMATIVSPVTVRGLEKLDTSKGYLYAVNHSSALDIPVVYANLPFQFRILAKTEIFRYPFLGWHLRRSGQLEINPEKPSVSSVRIAVKTLKDGMPVVIFPEGGRTATGQIKPFYDGAFFMAIAAQADIVPVALVGLYELLPMNTFHIQSRPLEMLVGEPISTKGYSTRDLHVVAAKVRSALEDLYYSRAESPDPR
jgi:1-acyl-sn-glycerol-3-phosphate acyltransferase